MTGIITRSAAARLAIRRSIVVRMGVLVRITWIMMALPIRSRDMMRTANTVKTTCMVMPIFRSNPAEEFPGDWET